VLPWGDPSRDIEGFELASHVALRSKPSAKLTGKNHEQSADSDEPQRTSKDTRSLNTLILLWYPHGGEQLRTSILAEGVGGLNTDIAHETDVLFRTPGDRSRPSRMACGGANCHPKVAATGKIVLQYSPGVGFLLALFPEDHQVAPLYAAATVLMFLVALAAIGLARSRTAILGGPIRAALR
jgi:hypothetical protein